MRWRVEGSKLMEEMNAKRRLHEEFKARVKVINFRKELLRQKQQALANYDEEPLKEQLKQFIAERSERCSASLPSSLNGPQ